MIVEKKVVCRSRGVMFIVCDHRSNFVNWKFKPFRDCLEDEWIYFNFILADRDPFEDGLIGCATDVAHTEFVVAYLRYC